MPSATIPTTVATGIRSPRMQGTPSIWPGSTVIRSNLINKAYPPTAGVSPTIPTAGFGKNRSLELPNFTQSLYDARELAMQRMQSEAQALGAKGIVGVDLQE